MTTRNPNIRLVRLPEEQYRIQLAGLIRDYDIWPSEKHCTEKGIPTWGTKWGAFLEECSPDQERRAEEVLRLHVKNQMDPLTRQETSGDVAH